MTSDGLLVLECLFSTVWRLFTTWNIPGTAVTPGGFLAFLVLAGIVLRWLSRLFDVQMGASVVWDKAQPVDRDH